MAKIEGFKIKNFRSLKNIVLGRLWNQQQAEPLTPMTAVIGKNGVGKSTLFDTFGFLADALKLGVEEACDSRGRGGFQKIRAQGQQEPIEFEVYYKETGNSRPITYEIAIDIDSSGRPFVLKERLRQRRKGQRHGWPFSFLMLNNGKGIVWKGEQEGRQIREDQEDFDLSDLMKSIKSGISKEESSKTEVVELEDMRKLGIATFGSLKQHPRIYKDLPEVWQSFCEKIETSFPDSPLELYGISYDDPLIAGKNNCWYDLCARVSRSSKFTGANYKTIPGGLFLIYRFDDHFRNLSQIYNDLFALWMPHKGYLMDNRLCFERYHEGTEAGGRLVVDICIPVVSGTGLKFRSK